MTGEVSVSGAGNPPHRSAALLASETDPPRCTISPTISRPAVFFGLAGSRPLTIAGRTCLESITIRSPMGREAILVSSAASVATRLASVLSLRMSRSRRSMELERIAPSWKRAGRRRDPAEWRRAAMKSNDPQPSSSAVPRGDADAVHRLDVGGPGGGNLLPSISL